ncbi:MAG TPA: nitrate ABC transporter ATP-binding protein [Opitutae bacterium]|nr:nitrate ABC transporter ATP-binding protein [Opitutae bacterium]
MFKPTPDYAIRTRRATSIRLGYVRLLDAAPLIVAESLGLFADAGLDVELSREVGWATIRDKLAFGELDVAQALSPMPFVMQLGINVAKTEVITGMVLNSNGNAITLSSELRDEGVDDGASLRRYIQSGFHPRKLVLGVVSLSSSHHFMLCRWLEQHGIDPIKDVIISVLPPEQMVRNIASHNLDGFCVGEPWNSLAIEEGLGWSVATSSEIAKGYPEKVLATTERFYSYRPDEYIRMVQVLREACARCSDSVQIPAILKILSSPHYLNCRPETLAHAFSESFPMGHGKTSEGAFIQFSANDVNRPDAERARLVYEDLCRFLPHPNLKAATPKLISRVFRESLYEQAMNPAVI